MIGFFWCNFKTVWETWTLHCYILQNWWIIMWHYSQYEIKSLHFKTHEWINVAKMRTTAFKLFNKSHSCCRWRGNSMKSIISFYLCKKRLFSLFTDEFDLLPLHIIGTFSVYVMLLLCNRSSGHLRIEPFCVLNSMFDISFVWIHLFWLWIFALWITV